MKYAAGWSLALVISFAADAAEPAGPPQAAKAPPLATAAPQAEPAPEADPPASTVTPPKRLDLRVGKIRDLMTRRQMAELLGAPDWEKDTIVVEGQRELLPMKFEEPIPGGPMALWWALKNPTQSWRVLLPDLNRPDPGPLTMEQKVPQREFRWGP